MVVTVCGGGAWGPFIQASAARPVVTMRSHTRPRTVRPRLHASLDCDTRSIRNESACSRDWRAHGPAAIVLELELVVSARCSDDEQPGFLNVGCFAEPQWWLMATA